MSDTLIKELKRVGLPAEYYKKPPLGRHLFSIALPGFGNTRPFKLHVPNKDKLELFTDKNHRQAVVNVDDAITDVPEKVKWVQYYQNENQILDNSVIARFASQRTRYSIPNSTFKVDKKTIKISDFRKGDLDSGYRNITCSGLHVPNKDQKKDVSILFGMDEIAHFISALPKAPKSVEEAHEMLKPKIAEKEGTLRQGEFFFVPCTDKEKKICAELLTSSSNIIFNGRLENDSNHESSMIIGKNIKAAIFFPRYDNITKYVIGKIKDVRRDRHNPLVFSEFHHVVRNNEIKVAQSTRNWD